MKILIATGIYPPDIGGPATYSKLLFDELPKRGTAVEVLSFGEVRHLPKIVRHFAYFFKTLKGGSKADVIFAQDPVSVGFPSALAAKVLRKKFILKIVGDYAWEQYVPSAISRQQSVVSLDDFQNGKFDWLTELRRKTQKWVAKNADKIITPSEYLKKIVENWGINGEKITIIYNAFSAPELEISKEGARKKLTESRKLPAGGFLIISAGRLVPWKGFGTLIKIMPEILKEIPDAKLYIVGSGPERETLEVLVANHGLRDNVFLLGQLPHEDSLLCLRAGDLFVLNTGYEGFSHFILEAMAMEIPIITTNIGGNPEIITDKENGILIKYENKEQLKNAIINLRANNELKNKITRNARIKINEFSKERMIKETMDFLRGIDQ